MKQVFKEVALKSFAGFVKVALREGHRHGIAWRGQANSSWSLSTSAYRAYAKRDQLYFPGRDFDAVNGHYFIRTREMMKGLSRQVQKALAGDSHFRLLLGRELSDRDIADHPERFAELLAICQHYGMATTLLDVSSSAYVALYFAAKDALSRQGEWEATSRMAVWKLPAYAWREELRFRSRPPTSGGYVLQPDSAGEANLTIRNFFSRQFISDRQRAQNASFIIVDPPIPLGEAIAWTIDAFPGELREDATRDFVKYTLPVDEALDCLVQLNKMNINSATLFPDLAGQMEHINLLGMHYDLGGIGDPHLDGAYHSLPPHYRRMSRSDKRLA